MSMRFENIDNRPATNPESEWDNILNDLYQKISPDAQKFFDENYEIIAGKTPPDNEKHGMEILPPDKKKAVQKSSYAPNDKQIPLSFTFNQINYIATERQKSSSEEQFPPDTQKNLCDDSRETHVVKPGESPAIVEAIISDTNHTQPDQTTKQNIDYFKDTDGGTPTTDFDDSSLSKTGSDQPAPSTQDLIYKAYNAINEITAGDEDKKKSPVSDHNQTGVFEQATSNDDQENNSKDSAVENPSPEEKSDQPVDNQPTIDFSQTNEEKNISQKDPTNQLNAEDQPFPIKKEFLAENFAMPMPSLIEKTMEGDASRLENVENNEKTDEKNEKKDESVAVLDQNKATEVDIDSIIQARATNQPTSPQNMTLWQKGLYYGRRILSNNLVKLGLGTAAASAALTLSSGALAVVATGGVGMIAMPLLFAAGTKCGIEGAVGLVQRYLCGGRRLEKQVQHLDSKLESDLNILRQYEQSADQDFDQTKQTIKQEIRRLHQEHQQAIADLNSWSRKHALIRSVIGTVSTIGIGLVGGVPLGFQNFDGDSVSHLVRFSARGFEYIFGNGELSGVQQILSLAKHAYPFHTATSWGQASHLLNFRSAFGFPSVLGYAGLGLSGGYLLKDLFHNSKEYLRSRRHISTADDSHEFRSITGNGEESPSISSVDGVPTPPSETEHQITNISSNVNNTKEKNNKPHILYSPDSHQKLCELFHRKYSLNFPTEHADLQEFIYIIEGLCFSEFLDRNQGKTIEQIEAQTTAGDNLVKDIIARYLDQYLAVIDDNGESCLSQKIGDYFFQQLIGSIEPDSTQIFAIAAYRKQWQALFDRLGRPGLFKKLINKAATSQRPELRLFAHPELLDLPDSSGYEALDKLRTRVKIAREIITDDEKQQLVITKFLTFNQEFQNDIIKYVVAVCQKIDQQVDNDDEHYSYVADFINSIKSGQHDIRQFKDKILAIYTTEFFNNDATAALETIKAMYKKFAKTKKNALVAFTKHDLIEFKFTNNLTIDRYLVLSKIYQIIYRDTPKNDEKTGVACDLAIQEMQNMIHDVDSTKFDNFINKNLYEIFRLIRQSDQETIINQISSTENVETNRLQSIKTAMEQILDKCRSRNKDQNSESCPVKI